MMDRLLRPSARSSGIVPGFTLAVAMSLSTACVSHAGLPATRPSTDESTAPSSDRRIAEPDPFDPARHLHTAEVTPGMTGYGLSVFRGTKIERFEVEVISVMRNQDGPNHNVILIRCRGQGLEHSGAIEGMSGSPIYLTDAAGKSRLAGAFALGWENNKDPIAGVRPIEEMLRVPTAASPATTRPTAKTSAIRWNAKPLITGLTAKPAAVRSDSSRLQRLSLPLSIGGVSDAAFRQLSPMFRLEGLTPLQGGATVGADADPAAKLEPGAAIGLPIVTGDLDVSALGTVTEVIGNRIYAFGHEFNSEGPVDLPMGVGYVHTIIPANTISFKIGSLLRLDGAIHSDESTAIAGLIGPTPAMIPVTVTVRTPQRADAKTYHFQIARHPKFTPMGALTSLTAALSGDSGLGSEFTVKYAMKLEFDGGETVSLADTTTSATQGRQLARDLNLPLTLALQNPFGRAYPKSITASFDVEPRVRLDELKSVTCDKMICKPGETLDLYLTTQAYDGGTATHHVEFAMPDELAEGEYTLTVGDADRTLADETRDAPYRFETRSLAEVFGLIREVTHRPSQRLYLRLASHGQGLSTGRTPLQGLPPSRVRVLSRPGQAGVMPYVPSITRELPWASPLRGSVDIEVKVSKTPEKEPRTPSQPNATPLTPTSPDTLE